MPATLHTSRKRSRGSVAGIALAACVGEPLVDLGPLVRATIVRRPSSRNRSPYVGDIKLGCGREAICHFPSQDMGGKCIPGADALVRIARDAKGEPVGANATGKYGTPKCEFILQLLRTPGEGGCWVGAHPSIGEKVANALLTSGALADDLGPCASLRREVTGFAGTDMRVDFVIDHVAEAKAGKALDPGDSQSVVHTLVEVKTVVDADTDGIFEPTSGVEAPATTTAVFPWGRPAQKGPEGEKVVSARAIRHVRELTTVARRRRDAIKAGADAGTNADARVAAAVLFVAPRADVGAFAPNAEKCPSFARYLHEAAGAGVHLIARRVVWGEAGGPDEGRAFDGGPLPVRA